MEKGNKVPAYEVLINLATIHPAETEDEVWAIIMNHPIGSLYEVSSPQGLDVDQFIPY